MMLFVVPVAAKVTVESVRVPPVPAIYRNASLWRFVRSEFAHLYDRVLTRLTG